MRRYTFPNSCRALAFATSTAAFLAAANCSMRSCEDQFEHEGQDPNLLLILRRHSHTKVGVWKATLGTISQHSYNTRIRPSSTKCEVVPNHRKKYVGHQSNESKQEGMDYYYVKMEPEDMFKASILDSHAVFGPLLGAKLIERFNVYKRVNNDAFFHSKEQTNRNESVVVDLKIGTRLNGYGGVVHGGVISLVLDTALGFACIGLLEDEDSIAVTASLKIDFLAPLKEGSEAVVRVYLDRIEGRKLFFAAILENKDGSVVYAEAKSLFIKIGSVLL